MIEGAQSDFEINSLNVDINDPNNSEVIFRKELGDQQPIFIEIPVYSDDMLTVLQAAQKYLRQFMLDLPELIPQIDRFVATVDQRIWIKTISVDGQFKTTTVELSSVLEDGEITFLVPIAFTLSATLEQIKEQCMIMLTELVEQSATYASDSDSNLE